MRDTNVGSPRRTLEFVLAACAVWLVLQNTVLFVTFAWRPASALWLATGVLIRVALHAVAPVTIVPGAGLLDLACILLTAGTGVRHG